MPHLLMKIVFKTHLGYFQFLYVDLNVTHTQITTPSVVPKQLSSLANIRNFLARNLRVEKYCPNTEAAGQGNSFPQ